jgi:hypothetical protein
MYVCMYVCMYVVDGVVGDLVLICFGELVFFVYERRDCFAIFRHP